MLKAENNSLFHSKIFVELISKSFKNTVIKSFIIGDALIYGIETKHYFIKQLYILPFGLYLPNFSLENYNKFLEIIKIEKKKYQHIVINNFPNNNLNIKINAFKKIDRTCHILNLNKPLEVLLKDFSETRQKHIKRIAKRNELKIFATNNEEYFKEYYQIYLNSLERWKESSPAYSYDLISNLYKVENLKLWVAELNGKMLSGMICFYGDNCVFDWLAATLINEDYKKLYPAVAVQYEVIKHAINNGYNFVNMGASDNLSGVKEFKESWNADTVQYQTIIYQSKLFRLLKNIQNLFIN